MGGCGVRRVAVDDAGTVIESWLLVVTHEDLPGGKGALIERSSAFSAFDFLCSPRYYLTLL